LRPGRRCCRRRRWGWAGRRRWWFRCRPAVFRWGRATVARGRGRGRRTRCRRGRRLRGRRCGFVRCAGLRGRSRCAAAPIHTAASHAARRRRRFRSGGFVVGTVAGKGEALAPKERVLLSACSLARLPAGGCWCAVSGRAQVIRCDGRFQLTSSHSPCGKCPSPALTGTLPRKRGRERLTVSLICAFILLLLAILISPAGQLFHGQIIEKCFAPFVVIKARMAIAVPSPACGGGCPGRGGRGNSGGVHKRL